MSSINSYLLNCLLSVTFIESISEIAKVQLLTNIFDLIIMFLMVLVSRFVSNYVEIRYKKFIIKLKNWKK